MDFIYSFLTLYFFYRELKKIFSSMRSELEEKFKFSEHPQAHYLIISSNYYIKKKKRKIVF